MDGIKIGSKFRYRSKHDGSYYFGVVGSIYLELPNSVYFYSENGVAYKSEEVEWLDEIRDQKLKDLGI
jgi:hypothetical protein